MPSASRIFKWIISMRLLLSQCCTLWSDCLRTWRSGARIPAAGRDILFLRTVQTQIIASEISNNKNEANLFFLVSVHSEVWFTVSNKLCTILKFYLFCVLVIHCSWTTNKMYLPCKFGHLLFYIRHSPKCYSCNCNVVKGIGNFRGSEASKQCFVDVVYIVNYIKGTLLWQ